MVLAGKFDSGKKTIHVEKIAPAAQQGGPKYGSDPEKSD
jgi:hypothetical protein